MRDKELDEIKKYWDYRHSEKVGLAFATKEQSDIWVSLISKYIKRNKLNQQSLLDYGTWTGLVSLGLKEQLRIPKVVAADISDEGIDKELLKKSGVHFIQANQPKEVGGKYDIILCVSVFHHIAPKYVKQFMAQFSDMLSENGILLIASFDKTDSIFMGKKKKLSALNMPVYATDIYSNKDYLKEIGLRSVERGTRKHSLRKELLIVHNLVSNERVFRYGIFKSAKVTEKEQAKSW